MKLSVRYIWSWKFSWQFAFIACKVARFSGFQYRWPAPIASKMTICVTIATPMKASKNLVCSVEENADKIGIETEMRTWVVGGIIFYRNIPVRIVGILP